MMYFQDEWLICFLIQKEPLRSRSVNITSTVNININNTLINFLLFLSFWYIFHLFSLYVIAFIMFLLIESNVLWFFVLHSVYKPLILTYDFIIEKVSLIILLYWSIFYLFNNFVLSKMHELQLQFFLWFSIAIFYASV